MKSIKLSACLASIIISMAAYSQNKYTGYALDNYAGYTSSYFQPAAIVNSLQKISVTSSLNILSSNNYSGRNGSILSLIFGNENLRYRDHISKGYEMNSFEFDVIGVSYEINHENAIGYSFRIRAYGNIDGLDQDWTNAIHNDYDDTKPVNLPIAMTNYSFNQFIFNEHRFNYARVLIEDRENFIKAGAAVKLINGIDAVYLYSKEGQFEFNNAFGSNGTITNTEFSYGKAEKDNMFSSRTLGFGLDLGAVYEYRPNYNSYKYDMDGEKDIKRYDQTKYLFKIGASITDIGRVRFSKDTNSFDFNSGQINQNIGELGGLGLAQISGAGTAFLQDFDSLAVNSTKNTNQDDRFNMNLPTSLNLMGDYKVWKSFYLGYASTISIKRKADANKVHTKSIHSIIPRWDGPKVGVSVPVSIQRNGQFNVGTSLRITPGKGAFSFFAGSHNITNVLGKRALYNTNFFTGLCYNIRYKIPSDIDGDKVSDGKDDCKYDPGLLALNGCPDTDGDGIPDKEDYCIYAPGPKEHNGCPDSDGDGVIDLNDQCPDEPGLAVHYGCPDRDKDGVIDVADRCPDVPGIEFNNGCPFENPGCCTDNDGDGVTNKEDKCPEISGSIYNDGCPIDSSNIEKIELNENKKEVDPNHTEEKIEEIKSEQEIQDVPDGTLISQLTSDNKIETLNVYFNTDDATLADAYNEKILDLSKRFDFSENSKYQVVIIGHTDNDGSENYNLILSKKRAETVRRKLQAYGADYDQIEVYYYGEWKPLKDNNNEAQKKFNRRVEIQILKK